MTNRFTLGKKAIAICDRCGQRFLLSKLKNNVVKTKTVSIKTCDACYDPDHPQLQLGMYPVADPQALRDPRSDSPERAQSRVFEWGWNPVGGARANDNGLTPNALVSTTYVGTVTVVVS